MDTINNSRINSNVQISFILLPTQIRIQIIQAFSGVRQRGRG
jgi:hypothetical protein